MGLVSHGATVFSSITSEMRCQDALWAGGTHLAVSHRQPTHTSCCPLLQLANKLFDVTIEAADGEVPVWNKDVRFFVVKSGGKPKAHFYFGEDSAYDLETWSQ